MESAILGCPETWKYWLPYGTRRLKIPEEAEKKRWPLLALTQEGLDVLERISCGILLMPGNCSKAYRKRIHADCVITYGLSRRDSLTLSSLETPVLCVQRTLPRPDGGIVEPQELLLPPLPAAPAELLPLIGLYLLQMPLNDRTASGKIKKT